MYHWKRSGLLPVSQSPSSQRAHHVTRFDNGRAGPQLPTHIVDLRYEQGMDDLFVASPDALGTTLGEKLPKIRLEPPPPNRPLVPACLAEK